jgi:hypothetical protein
MSLFRRGAPHRSSDHARASEVTETVARPTSLPPLKPQQLGPKQLQWLEDRFKFYGIHRKQAEAQTGVAVVHSIPPQVEETASSS